RKGDGEPGAKTIWLGLREVHVAAKTLRLLSDDGGDDICV
ncbi:IS4 family transposase, partial [Paraburkholderia elongata]